MLSTLRIRDTIQSAQATDVLTFSHDADRADYLSGKAYGRILGSIEEVLELDGLEVTRVAHPYSKLVGSKAWGDPLSMNRTAFIAALRRRLFRLLGNTDSTAIKTYRKLLASTRPKVILCIGAPSELCRVAKEKRIPLIEVLHGKGYSKVPWDWEKREINALPSGVVAFDPVSTSTFQSISPSELSVWQISDPWLSKFKTENQLSLPDEWKDLYTKPPSGRPVILFSLQWGYAGDHGDYSDYEGVLTNGLIPEAVLQTIAETWDSFDWLLRMHPAQKTGRLFRKQRAFLDRVAVANPNVDWEWASSAPLPIVLSQVTHHVTMSSMTAYEAAAVNVPTLLLCPTLVGGGLYEDMFLDLVDQGVAQKRSCEKPEIIEWVDNESSIKRQHTLGNKEFTTREFSDYFNISELIPRIERN